MIRKTGILTFILFWLGMQLQAQHAEAYSRLERDSLMIGDQVGLELGINVPEGFLVSWPALSDTISSHVEIVNLQDIDTARKENTLILNRKLTITSFDSGYFKIPSYTFHFHHEGDTVSYEARTKELYIDVYTPAVDTTQAFKVIKAPIEEPYTFREALPWILLGLLVIAIILATVWFVRRRKKKKPLFASKPKPQLPPHVEALQRLEELKAAKIWQTGKIKEYYTQLTDIIRNYMERRYGFNAPEMTTDEILDEIRRLSINKEATDKLKSTLTLADLVKFAKAKPTPLENDISLNNCIDFVQETKVVPVVQENSKPEPEKETKEDK